MTTTFTLLGTGGWIPTRRRETTCGLLSMPQALFIFDAGTGLSRLLEERFRAELDPGPGSESGAGSDQPAAGTPGGREIHIFLSHYHLDHVAGLVYLPAFLKGRTVHLHPPATEITGLNPHEVIGIVVGRPFNPSSLEDFPVDMIIESLQEGEHAFAGATVTVQKQIHADASVAFRVDDKLVFATDTTAKADTVQLSRGVNTLVHEAWIDGVEESTPGSEQVARDTYLAHTSARQAAEIAKEAGVGQLVLCHLIPVRSEAYHEQMLASAREIFPNTKILEDGEPLPLP